MSRRILADVCGCCSQHPQAVMLGEARGLMIVRTGISLQQYAGPRTRFIVNTQDSDGR
jgi:hypothetical protein